MKIAFNTFTCPDWNLNQIVEAAERIGYQGVELRCGAGHGHGVEIGSSRIKLQDMARLLEKHSVEPCCIATSMQFATDAVMDQAPALVDLAAGLGCPGLRVFCGPVPGGRSLSEAIDKAGQQLQVIAEIAEPIGIQLWVETHDSFSLGASAAGAVRRANHPAVGVLYDNLHPYRRGEPVDATIATIAGMVRHVHFHDGLNLPDKVVIRPFGKGELPLDEMFRGLLNTGYDGFVCGEWFHGMYGEDRMEALTNYFNDMTGLAAQHGVKLGSPPE